MMNVLRVVLVVTFAALLGIHAITQTAVPPPPRSAEQEAHADAAPKVKISAGVAAGMLLQKTVPLYPSVAKAARVSGTVVLHATISETGSIESLSVISGPNMLRESAMDAVKTWRYRPYLLANEPVEIETTINVIYKLGGGEPPAAPATNSQTAVPPQATPADGSPSLAVTMQFIQDKLNDIGKVNYVSLYQDITDGSTGSNTITNEVSNVVADQSQCSFAYYSKETRDGSTIHDRVDWFTLRDVQDIVVRTLAQYRTEMNARVGLPNLIATSVNPPLTALLVRSRHGAIDFFPFTDADLADRVAKALTHAVELCGGGSKEPF